MTNGGLFYKRSRQWPLAEAVTYHDLVEKSSHREHLLRLLAAMVMAARRRFVVDVVLTTSSNLFLLHLLRVLKHDALHLDAAVDNAVYYDLICLTNVGLRAAPAVLAPA